MVFLGEYIRYISDRINATSTEYEAAWFMTKDIPIIIPQNPLDESNKTYYLLVNTYVLQKKSKLFSSSPYLDKISSFCYYVK